MSSDVLIGLFEPFLLVLTRLAGLLALLPMMGFEPSPSRARAVLAIFLALGMTASLPGYVPPESIAVALMFEALLGASMGITARILMATVEVAGELISIQMGFGFNKTVDPMTKSESGPITRILSIIATVLFFATGAYQSILRTLALSFRTIPPGSSEFRPDFEALVIDTGSTMMIAGARIALPLVLVAFMVQISFGLMTKVAPQMNIWGLGFTFTIAFGFIAVIVFTPTFVGQAAALLDKIVDDVAGLALVR